MKKTPASAASGYFDCYLEVFFYLVVFIFSHFYDTFLDSYLFMSRKKLFLCNYLFDLYIYINFLVTKGDTSIK